MLRVDFGIPQSPRAQVPRNAAVLAIMFGCWVTALNTSHAQHIDLASVLVGLDEPAQSWNTIAPQLQERGVAAVDSLIALRQLVAEQTATADFQRRVLAAAKLKRLDQLIDRVAGQPHASSSGLFWYDALDRAQDEARRSHRPILLVSNGRDPACARLFALLYYANREIGATLSRDFVLCAPLQERSWWLNLEPESSRPANQQGNGFFHVVLDATARPIHALREFVGPRTFHLWLRETESLWRDVYQLSDEMFLETVAQQHVTWERRLNREANSGLAVELDTASRILFEQSTPWTLPRSWGAGELGSSEELSARLGERARLKDNRQVHHWFQEGIFTRSAAVLLQKLGEPE